jgi:hypothetical protein
MLLFYTQCNARHSFITPDPLGPGELKLGMVAGTAQLREVVKERYSGAV